MNPLIPLVQIQRLKKHFLLQNTLLKAVDDLSLNIHKGETLGLVGESGCGKSTLGKMLMGLESPTEGSIHFASNDLGKLSSSEKKQMYRKMQIIFQDPYSSLNPRMTVADILKEPFKIHALLSKSKMEIEVESLLSLVKMDRFFLSKYPHELSGGQRQRVGIARALALRPQFLVCDEPLSALDVSVQAQIINLLKELQTKLQLTYLFIAHDLGIIKYISTRVAVMYLGKIIELAPTQELYENPLHPYTQALLSSIPIPDPIRERQRTKILLQGEASSPTRSSRGCIFSSRCPHAETICHQIRPKWRESAPGHFAACHRLTPLASPLNIMQEA
jgi:peptide/nickel transport system ATP-binding protein/oligopeptide transport system ATP-binding protein